MVRSRRQFVNNESYHSTSSTGSPSVVIRRTVRWKDSFSDESDSSAENYSIIEEDIAALDTADYFIQADYPVNPDISSTGHRWGRTRDWILKTENMAFNIIEYLRPAFQTLNRFLPARFPKCVEYLVLLALLVPLLPGFFLTDWDHAVNWACDFQAVGPLCSEACKGGWASSMFPMACDSRRMAGSLDNWVNNLAATYVRGRSLGSADADKWTHGLAVER